MSAASEPSTVVEVVALDVRQQLDPFFRGIPTTDEAFVALPTFGDGGLVVGEGAGRRFEFVRWRWTGRHVTAIPDRTPPILLPPRGHPPGEPPPSLPEPRERTLVRPTGNIVVVEGLTVIEDGVLARWFIDWLSVYAQLGLVMTGRPVGMSRTEVRDFTSDDPVPETELGSAT